MPHDASRNQSSDRRSACDTFRASLRATRCVRHTLREARAVESRLEKSLEAIWKARLEAERAFVEGWPKVTTGAPWTIR